MCLRLKIKQMSVADMKCPCKWMEFDENCYYFGKETKTKYEAIMQCEAFNSSLVEITTHFENKAIKRFEKDLQKSCMKPM